MNLACLGFHVWPYLSDPPEFTDELRLDLDPQPGVGFDEARAAAAEVDAAQRAGRRRLPEDHREPRHPRLRPARAALGLVPGAGRSVAAARELERRRPDLITAAWWKEERGRRIFVDYNQNAPHKTVFGALVRARPRRRPGVDALTWDEIDAVTRTS